VKIQTLHLLDGAKEARGITVIIDVFRAFSTACYAFNSGAVRIIPVASINTAYRIKKQNPGFILMGEREEQKPPGFDFGNSPAQLLNADLKGKTLIHTTSSGTQGIEAAVNASEIITGSFVNAGAIVSYIKKQNPELVSLVCMGYACEYPTDEDTLCAEFLKNELTGVTSNYPEMVKIIREGSGSRFFEPENQEWSPKEDFNLCLNLNHFNFVLKYNRGSDFNFLSKVDVV